jgi:hypothetical protein
MEPLTIAKVPQQYNKSLMTARSMIWLSIVLFSVVGEVSFLPASMLFLESTIKNVASLTAKRVQDLSSN